MSLHHSFSIQDLKRQCVYCSTPFSEASWKSIHEGTQLYKTMNCSCCGKHIMIPVSFLGSGHDSWDGKHSWVSDPRIKVSKTNKKIKNLESRIKILAERTYP